MTGFDAQDEQITATLGTAQPYRFEPGPLLGPEPGHTQTITCGCAAVAESIGQRDTTVPCVELAGPSGLCPACEQGLCVKTETTEAAA